MRFRQATLFLAATFLFAFVAEPQTQSQQQELAKPTRDGQAATSTGGKIVIATGSKIVLLDRESKAVLWESEGLNGAYSVDVLPEGGFIVGEGKSIARLDENGKVLSRMVSTKFKSTTDVKMLENGRMLVSDGRAGTVTEMDWSGKTAWAISMLHHPSEAVRLENGDTLVADGTARLKQFNSEGTLVGTARLQRWAASVQRVSDGRTLVGESLGIELLDRTGQALWSRTTTSRVFGVQQITDDEYLIAEFDNKRLIILDAQGNIAWEAKGFGAPHQAIYLK
jgi:hypothetical protein